MKIFISHSSKNHDLVDILVDDLKAAGYDVWLDDEQLSGSQEWWASVLENIRLCDLFIFALSPQSLESLACKHELEYAVSLDKRIIPVKLKEINLSFIHPELQQRQVEDYIRHDKQQILRLWRAINKLPPAQPLPDPLPIEPEIPLSELTKLARQLDAPSLTEDVQRLLISKLEEYLDHEDTFKDAKFLLVRLRTHSGLYASSEKRIASLLGRQAPLPPATTVRPVNLQPRVFDGHMGAVAAVVFSPTVQFIVTGSEDERARSWNAETGEQICEFENDTDVRSLALSPDGKFLVTNCLRGARLWNALNGKKIHDFEINNESGLSIAISPNGRYMLSGSINKTARLWELQSGQPVRLFSRHFESVHGVAFSPNGKVALTLSRDSMIRLFDVETGELTKSYKHQHALAAIFLPSGNSIATATARTIRLWMISNDMSEFNDVPLDTEANVGIIDNIAVSPDGARLLLGTDDNAAYSVDIATGKILQKFVGHDHVIRSVAWSPDGRYVLTGSRDYTARLWKVDVAE